MQGKSTLETLSDDEVRAAFQKHGGAVQRTADSLQTSFKALKNRLATMGIGLARGPGGTPKKNPAAPRAPAPAAIKEAARERVERPARASSSELDDELATIGTLITQIRKLSPAARAYVADRLARGI